MKVIILFFLFIPFCWADAPDIRISDQHGHVAEISSAGALSVTTDTDSGTDKQGAPDIQISDADGDVIDITSAGRITLTF